MDREKIERLAIDSISGHLNEDEETLLKEYLAEHPQESKWFLEMQEIYRKTQSAFVAKTDFIKEQAENKISRKVNWFPVIRWAAVIIFSVGIGIAAGRFSKQYVSEQKPNLFVESDAQSVKKKGFRLDDLGEGFWRDKVTAMLNPSPVKVHREKSSSLSLLEQYRQYLKERNHE